MPISDFEHHLEMRDIKSFKLFHIIIILDLGDLLSFLYGEDLEEKKKNV